MILSFGIQYQNHGQQSSFLGRPKKERPPDKAAPPQLAWPDSKGFTTAMPQNPILITGASGFIGSHLVRHLLEQTQAPLINYDALTYAGNKITLQDIENNPRYHFIHANILDANKVKQTLDQHQPQYLFHLAAESHVDRSIAESSNFIETNVLGTHVLLEQSLNYWKTHPNFRFILISTDEVYGSLGPDGSFNENSPYAPNSPYSASKASADLIARSFYQTYQFPVIITHSSNNYGSHQYPEKLIPVVIRSVLEEKPIPVYGQGLNSRDWTYVEDNCEALWMVGQKGKIGEHYNIGAQYEISNIDLVKKILNLLAPKINKTYEQLEKLINFVTDRPGHDFRYALDTTKINQEIGWQPQTNFDVGLEKTISWYLENQNWVNTVLSSPSLDGRGLGGG